MHVVLAKCLGGTEVARGWSPLRTQLKQGYDFSVFWTLLSKTDKLLDSCFSGLHFYTSFVRKHSREVAVPVLFGLPSPAGSQWEPQLCTGAGPRAHFRQLGM